MENEFVLKKVSLTQCITWLWEDKFKVISFFILTCFISVFYALQVPNEYTSQVVLSSNLDNSKKFMAGSSNLGGLASLAGIDLSGGGMSPEVLKESILSDQFLAKFVRKNRLEAIVMAAEGYDQKRNDFLYNENIYDKQKKIWTRNVKFPLEKEPNEKELAVEIKKSLNADYSRKTKLITISYTSYSPYFPKKLLRNLVDEFNLYLRNKEIKEINRKISYLKGLIENEKVIEIKNTLLSLMEEQQKKMLIIHGSDEYAFKEISSPLKPNKRSKPNRVFICLTLTLVLNFVFIIILLTLRIVGKYRRQVTK